MEKRISPKKSLGQHFLRSKSVLEAMCQAANIIAGDWVLEIGPGEGTLTAVLLEEGATVVALEKDHRLIPELERQFADAIANKRLFLKEIDALDFNPAEIDSATYKIVANIPYYITGAILEKFLSTEFQPNTMVVLVQKEVAQRIVARDGKESLLSLSVKAYGQPDYVKTVSRRLFSPPPKVDSAILAIENISRKFFRDQTAEQLFFKIIKAGFAHKRKMLRNNLTVLAGEYNMAPQSLLTKTNINEQARAEELNLKQWMTMAEAIRP